MPEAPPHWRRYYAHTQTHPAIYRDHWKQVQWYGLQIRDTGRRKGWKNKQVIWQQLPFSLKVSFKKKGSTIFEHSWTTGGGGVGSSIILKDKKKAKQQQQQQKLGKDSPKQSQLIVVWHRGHLNAKIKKIIIFHNYPRRYISWLQVLAVTVSNLCKDHFKNTASGYIMEIKNMYLQHDQNT